MARAFVFQPIRYALVTAPLIVLISGVPAAHGDSHHVGVASRTPAALCSADSSVHEGAASWRLREASGARSPLRGPENGASFSGAWRQIPPTAPSRRDRSSITYDPVRERLILFGGYDVSFWLNDLWELRSDTKEGWVRLEAAGTAPPGRSNHSAIYDSAGDRIVIFGGHRNGTVLGDCWELSLTDGPRWRQIAPDGTAPPARAGHVAVCDAARDRMVVYGGDDGTSPPWAMGDVWSLSLSDPSIWTEETPLLAEDTTVAGLVGASSAVAPVPRTLAAAAFDSSRNRVVIHGGAGGPGPAVLLADCWALELGDPMRWRPITPTGPAPSARDGHSAILDAAHDRLVSFGGNVGVTRLDELWQLDLASLAWTLVAPEAIRPTARFLQATCFDPIRRSMVVFGGIEHRAWRGDTWAYDLANDSGWNVPSQETTAPDGRNGTACALDREHDRMLVFGGYGAVATGNDTWALSLSDHRWSPIVPAGPLPPGRHGAVAVHDPVRNRLLVFGGRGLSGSPWHNDVWALSLGPTPEWTLVQAGGTAPDARLYAAAAYDAALDRMIVYGGQAHYADEADRYDFPASSAFALSLGDPPTWTPLPSGPARIEMGYAWDSLRRRLVIAGGIVQGDYEETQLYSDLWSLSLDGGPAWSQLEPTVAMPEPRCGASLVFDPAADRLLLFGGRLWDDSRTNDIYTYAPGGSATWTPLLASGTPPSPRAGHAAVWDDLRHCLVVFGGFDGTNLYDVWELQAASDLLDSPAPVDPAPSASVVNPARGGRIQVAFAPDGSESARIALLDVAGRVVATRDVRGTLPGWQTVELGGNPALAPGLYFVRLLLRRAVTLKVCVLD